MKNWTRPRHTGGILLVTLITLGSLDTTVAEASALAAGSATPVRVFSPPNADPLEVLAAREVRRYVYLRTGQLLSIAPLPDAWPESESGIVVAQRNRIQDSFLAREATLQVVLSEIAVQGYLMETTGEGHRRRLLLCGGDAVGTLYAAYRFAEHLGVRFYLHGDVIPDGRIALQVPVLHERSKPLFALRGIQPFHDFPEGPDWWNRDHYLSVVSQLPKLRMNFIALHTYPEGKPNAEPTVWIGLPEDVGEAGRVKFSYPASYQNTRRGNWGYAAKKTSEFSCGAASLFERDDFGAEVMFDSMPEPSSPEACNEVFHRTGELLREAFGHAWTLGVKTCVGTETPLTVPKRVAERLQAAGKKVGDAAVVQELYEGIFRRAAAAYPLDYYWFWTPEGWTWEGTKDEQVKGTVDDLLAAIAAAKKVRAPFQLATCGWVLGPQQDRALFDKVLPKEVAVSCINREVGRTPVDKGFAEVSGRGKWAIPWLEDDPALTSPQLWVGRMRRDAADALRYGCDGLMGIHWRTRVLGPAVAALAQAAWNQEPWGKSKTVPMEPPRVAGPVGGQVAAFPNNAIADTADAALYQTVRYNLSAYYLRITNSPSKVTLKFCEPHYSAAGKRVFDVKLQGKTVLENLDIFARVGQNRALDYTFPNVATTNGWLDIEFVPRVEYPCIAAISVQAGNEVQNINCGGPAYGTYAADPPASPPPKPSFPSTDDFYLDWARCELGQEIARSAAAIFVKIDGALPRPSDWVNGPGGIKPDKRPWSAVREEYRFVDDFAALRGQVKGAGHRERFDYWLNTFLSMRSMAEVNCRWAESNQVAEKLKAEQDAKARRELARQTALPLRRQLVKAVSEMYDHLLVTVSSPGELGTVANWEQHLLPDLLTKPGRELAGFLGEELPPNARLPADYRGPMRIVVPTVRTAFYPGESLTLKVIVLSEAPPREVTLYSRPMGRGEFGKTPATHLARGVYLAKFRAEATLEEDLEYYVEAVPALSDKGPRAVISSETPDGAGDPEKPRFAERAMPVVFPVTARTQPQTMVMMARPGR